jgi:hypothetical protein
MLLVAMSKLWGIKVLCVPLYESLPINLAYISFPSIDTITNETTQKLANNVTSVYTYTPVGIESKIIILAVVFFILLFPQIKSFGVRDVKFELEPISKGSGGDREENSFKNN